MTRHKKLGTLKFYLNAYTYLTGLVYKIDESRESDGLFFCIRGSNAPYPSFALRNRFFVLSPNQSFNLWYEKLDHKKVFPSKVQTEGPKR